MIAASNLNGRIGFWGHLIAFRISHRLMGFLREKLKYRCNWGHVSLVVSHGKSDEADIGVIRRIEIRASLDLE